jgi:hypothetical protein
VIIAHLAEVHGTKVSRDTISRITDAMLEQMVFEEIGSLIDTEIGPICAQCAQGYLWPRSEDLKIPDM